MVKIRFKELGLQNAMHEVKIFLVRCQRCHSWLRFPEKDEVQSCGILLCFESTQILWSNFWGHIFSVSQNSSGRVCSHIGTHAYPHPPEESTQHVTSVWQDYVH